MFRESLKPRSMFFRESTYIWIPWSVCVCVCVCVCVLGAHLFKMQTIGSPETTGIRGSEGWGPGL